jgi:drug/metabolite transporter (DMT)-like permease
MLKPLALLISATVLWGLGNVAQKILLESYWPLTLVSLRCLLGALILLPFALPELRGGASLNALLRNPAAIVSCAAFCVALTLQQFAAGHTSVGNLGFLINLCSVFTPFLIWAVDRVCPGSRIILAAALAFLGAAMISGAGFDMKFGTGDAMCVLVAMAYAVWVVAVDRAVKATKAPAALTAMQLLATGIVGGAFALAQMGEIALSPLLALHYLIFLGIFATGLAFVLSVKAQAFLPACMAASVMNLEAVFSLMGGWLLLGESWTPLAGVGAAIMLTGLWLIQSQGVQRTMEARQ